jgi:hypothetical protein
LSVGRQNAHGDTENTEKKKKNLCALRASVVGLCVAFGHQHFEGGLPISETLKNDDATDENSVKSEPFSALSGSN